MILTLWEESILMVLKIFSATYSIMCGFWKSPLLDWQYLGRKKKLCVLQMKLRRGYFLKGTIRKELILKCFIEELKYPNCLRELMAHLLTTEQKEIIYSYVALNTEE